MSSPSWNCWEEWHHSAEEGLCYYSNFVPTMHLKWCDVLKVVSLSSKWMKNRKVLKGRESNAILFITTVEELFPRQAYLPSWIVVKEGQSIPNCSTQKTTLKYHRFRIPEGVISETDFLKLLQIYSWYQQSMPTPNHERSTDKAIGLLTRSANL